MAFFIPALYRAFVCAGPVFFALLLALAAPVLAQSTDAFTVEGVAVDITAANAVKAREQALAEAQVKAFEQLADTMLAPETRAAYILPDADTIMALVKDFEITNEQLSATRYKGVFTVRFRPALARQYLNVAPVQTAQPETPYDPYYNQAGPVAPPPMDERTVRTAPPVTYQPAYVPAPQVAASVGMVTVRARFASIQEWVRLRGALEQNRAFSLQRVVALRPKEALIELAFNGTQGDLQQALTGSGLSAWPSQGVVMDTAAPILDVGFGGYSVY